ncbi:hypothetical protein A3A74_07955 [Candidatus Roizmanbacteria bacterium RIFCSPLOWO2_01_FULL_35_13]|uniref:Uncharacterized protein n=1 Tax=Candidatus Roizmanbacteria bacterium RIFCSPLOWO2_01_FULL_35_13 TaxID=1802055 RepID=A0A1F7IF85_9BACT|nr:MAG: hypothetical protein A3A74_07955 [Candidatus Roizmanbacteria bacterium RIFCSPLOWO2_01_FULL_35_13]
MNKLPFQILFLIICMTAVAYLNRNNFGGPAQKVFRFWLPKQVIIGGLCVILGFFFWITVNILLWQFGK